METCGAVAQLGERLGRIEEVVGSIPIGSTCSHRSRPRSGTVRFWLSHLPRSKNQSTDRSPQIEHKPIIQSDLCPNRVGSRVLIRQSIQRLPRKGFNRASRWSIFGSSASVSHPSDRESCVSRQDPGSAGKWCSVVRHPPVNERVREARPPGPLGPGGLLFRDAGTNDPRPRRVIRPVPVASARIEACHENHHHHVLAPRRHS